MSKEKPEELAAPTPGTAPIEKSSQSDLSKYLEVQTEGQEVLLPDSRLVFKVTRPNMSDLLQEGVIPDELVSAALEIDEIDYKPKTKDELLNMKAVIAKTIIAATVWPKLVEDKDKYDDGEFPISKLTERDQIAIYIFVGRGPAALEPFRPEQEGSLPGQSAQEVPGNETERADGDQGSGDSV